MTEAKATELPTNNLKAEGGYDLAGGWAEEVEVINEFQSFVTEYPVIREQLLRFDKNPREVVDKICPMIQRYQAQPELLDPHLEDMVSLVMAPVKTQLDQRAMEFVLHRDFIVNCGFEVIYALTATRGYKTIVRYLPHEVSDLEPVLDYVTSLPNNHETNALLWKTRYGLMLWLSIIVLIPFDLASVDSKGGIVSRLLQLVQTFLDTPQKVREGAAVMIARLFARPDLQATQMTPFFHWCQRVLDSEDANQFLTIGVFHALAEIFKHAPREVLVDKASIIVPSVERIWSSTKSRILRKYVVKLAQRIGLVFLPPIVAKWRYNKQRHVILSAQSGTIDEKTESVDLEDDSEHIHVPDEVDRIVDQLLGALGNQETIVRWSAAKGIGRITMRLPKQFGDQIVTNVLDLLSPAEDEDAWHGGCLCLAELARRGLLLPARLPGVVDRLKQAMLYEKFQGQYSKGSNVRDAGCYVAWAFARAYEPDVMQPYVADLARGLLIMAVFDREGQCRRAACAAFQENVGRQGNFPHGMDIIKAADYWTVGLLKNAFMVVSKEIAKYDDYQAHMIQHVVNIALQHWDIKIRELASNTLYELADLCPEYILSSVLPILINKCQSHNLFERHGALLGAGKCIARLTELNATFSEDLQKAIRRIVPKLEKNKLYKGRGGDNVRKGACELIASFANAEFPLMDKTIDRLQQTLDDNLRSHQGPVRESALKAFETFCKVYYATSNPERIEGISLKWCRALETERNFSVCRGYVRGLGVLSPALAVDNIKIIVDTLIRKSLWRADQDFRDSETRMCCVIALADLVERLPVEEYEYTWTEAEDEELDSKSDDDELAALGIQDVTRPEDMAESGAVDESFIWSMDIADKACSSLMYDRIGCALLNRLEDYEVDRRGDIGSFVREKCLGSLFRVIRVLAAAGNKPNGHPWLRPDLTVAWLRLALRQLGEKLDRVRRAAGEVITKLFDVNDTVMQGLDFPSKQELAEIFTDAPDMDWSFGERVFPMLAETLRLPVYRRFTFEGMIQSLGALSSSQNQVAFDALKTILVPLKSSQEAEAIRFMIDLGDDLLYMIEKRAKRSLFIVPIFKAIGNLFVGGYFHHLRNEQCDFAKSLMRLGKKECYKSADINKLLSAVPMFVGLSLFPQTREAALQRLMIFLGYQYPILRKHTAEQVLVAIITYGEDFLDSEDAQDAVQDIMLETQWVGAPVAHVRENRNKLFDLFGIKPPALKKRKK